MARIKNKLLTAAIRAPFQKRFGINANAANTTNSTGLPMDWAHDNTSEERWRNAADTDDVRVASVDSDNTIQIGEEVVQPMRRTITFNLAKAASLTTQVIFIAPRAYRITGISWIHATAESTAATMTAYVEKLTGTTAPGSGTTVQTGTFNCKATANTLQSGVLFSTGTGDSDDPVLQLAAGDRLGVVFSVAGTELQGLTLAVTIAPCGTEMIAAYRMKANGDLADQTFFLANRDYIVTGAFYVHSTLGTNGSAVNVQLVKDTSTNAPGAGTDLLTNNTNAGFDCKGAINTVQTGTLTATAASLRMAPGDRLSVDYAGTLTAVAGVVLIVTLQAVERQQMATFTVSANGDQAVDQTFFVADRNYELLAISQVHSVAAGGASKIQVTRDTATTAPGAGTDLLSNNTNAGFDLAATANTVQLGTFVDARFNFLMAGDRLSVDYGAAALATAGVTITATLAPR